MRRRASVRFETASEHLRLRLEGLSSDPVAATARTKVDPMLDVKII